MIIFKKNGLFLLFLLLLQSCSIKGESSLSHQSKQEFIENKQAHPKILQEVNQALIELNACEGQIDVSVSDSNSSIYPINKQKKLVELLCFLGAYQGNYEYFLYEKNDAKFKITPLTLPVFEVDPSGNLIKTNTRSIGGIPDYNSDQQILTIVTKYRGLGDCGSLAKYKWEEKEFKILEYRVKATCDGTYLEPEQYSQVYP